MKSLTQDPGLTYFDQIIDGGTDVRRAASGEAFAQMLAFRREVKHRSLVTLEAYESSIPLPLRGLEEPRHQDDHRDRNRRPSGEDPSEKLTPKTVNNHIGNCKAVFAFAVKRAWLDESPAKHVDPLDNPATGKLKFLTVANLEELCKAVPDDRLGRMEIMYRVTFETGMRQGEVLALRWHDLDWTANRISVERSNNGRTGEEDGPTKNKKPRSVPMTVNLRDRFEDLFRMCLYKSREDRIFCHPETGRKYDRSKCRKRLEAAYLASGVGGHVMKANKAGKPYKKAVLTFHSLRHSYGTALAMGGRKAIEIKELMGPVPSHDRQVHALPRPTWTRQIRLEPYSLPFAGTFEGKLREGSDRERNHK